MFARTAPPKKTMCLLLGGSSILTLNFCLFLLVSTVTVFQTWRSTHAQSLGVSLQDSGQPELLEFLFQSAGKTRVHAATTRQDNGLVQTRSDIDVGGLDGVEEEFGDTRLFDVDKVRLEQTFGGFEAFGTDANDATVGEGVRFDQNGRVFAELLVEGEVVGNVTELLFDGADGLEIGGSVEGVTTTGQERDEVACDVSSSDIESSSEMVEDGALVYRNNVGDTITAVDDDTRRQTLGVEGKDGLDGDIDTAKVVAFEHDFGHHFAVLQGVHGRFGEEDLAAGGVDLHLLEEGVVPEVLHVVPALDDTVFHLHGVALACVGIQRVLCLSRTG